MVFPKPTETAILTVNGINYTDWETISVVHELRDFPFYRCRFTTSEGVPLVQNFAALRIRPGMYCTVSLAGELAFTGKVEIRQVFMDAKRHHIEIVAISNQIMATASVISQTMNWKDKTFGDIARDILGKMNIPVVFEGGPEPTFKFPRASAHHGQPVLEFLDELSRGLPSTSGMGLAFTGNIAGAFVVMMGPSGGNDQVVEGQNALILREIIYNINASGVQPAVGQLPGTDQQWGAKVAHKPFDQKTFQSFADSFTPHVVVSEIPVWAQSVLSGRVANESSWQQSDQITVIVTVQGWLKPSGGLWYRGQPVSVISPSLIMTGSEGLTAKTVEFTQDNESGTRTTLTLCNELAMGGFIPQVADSPPPAQTPKQPELTGRIRTNPDGSPITGPPATP